jgi:type I restriction enzyme R subunit
LFDDPDWDGPPIQDEDFGKVSQPTGTATKTGAKGNGDGDDVGANRDRTSTDPSVPINKYRVGRQEFQVIAERVSYYNNGQLTTESLKDYTRRTVSEAYQSLDRFLNKWNEVDRKQAIVEELEGHGVILEALKDMVGKDYDLFDLVCHVAFDRPALTRKERADKVRKRDVFAKYGETARTVLNALLDKYADQGIIAIEDTKVLQLDSFAKLGTPVELVRSFGNKQQYKAAIRELESLLHEDQRA